MGTRGPIPKRTDEPQSKGALAGKAGVSRVLSTSQVKAPEPDPRWGYIARMVWDAACKSPQMKYYEDTDWAVLYNLCDDLDYFKAQERRGAQMMATINQMMTCLLLTEADRRRVGIEIQRATDEQLASPGIVAMQDLWEKRKRAISK